MKRGLIFAILISLAGCTTHTEFGPCIGIADDKDPKLIYKVSAWNAAMAVIFFELIAPPIIVLVDETFCPVGKKPEHTDTKSAQR